MKVHILRKVQKDPGTSVQRIAASEGISAPLVQKILCKQSLYPYYIQQVHDLISLDHARTVFCQGILGHTDCS
jgi:hypothetical protein